MKKLTFVLSLILGLNIISKAQQTATTGSYSDLTQSSVTLYGSCNGDGDFAGSGILYNTSSTVDINNKIGDAPADIDGSFSVSVSGLSASTQYHYCAYVINSSYEYTYGSVSSFTTTSGFTPVQISNLVITNVTSNSMSFQWTNGNLGNRMLVGRKTSAAELPTDGNSYTSNTIFGSGNSYGTAPLTYVLYSSTGNSTTITNVISGTTYDGVLYNFAALEYSTGGTPNPDYLTDNVPTISRYSMARTPNVAASNITFSSVLTTSMTVGWTAGTSDYRKGVLVLARAGSAVNTSPTDGVVYTANSAFGTGSVINTDNYVVYCGDATSINVTNLSINTTYYFQVFEYNANAVTLTNLSTPNYYPTSAPTGSHATLKDEPTVQAHDITFSNVASTTLTVNWTRGDATNNDGCIVVAKAGSSINNTPADNTDYAENLNFTSAAELVTGSGERVVYQGTGTTANITGLTAGTNYYFRVYEYNNPGSGTINYLTSTGTNNPNSTYTAPSTAATSINFCNVTKNQVCLYWTNGNGTNRIVTVHAASVGTDPVNGSTYTADYTFGSGSNLGNNTYVVYDGSGTISSSNPITISGLSSETVYYFEVYEYSGSGSSSIFLTSGGSNNPRSTSTLKDQPTTQSSNITFSNITSTSMRVNFTRGNGDGVLVLCKANATIYATPSDGTTYTADGSFTGNGTIIGTSAKTVYIGSNNYCDVTNLAPNTTYYIRVFEYNNSSSNIDYYTVEATNNPNSQLTNVGAPTTQESGVTLIPQDGAITFNWTAGNGNSRVAFLNTSSSFSNPTDGTNYTANATYTSGQQCVYNNTGTSVTVTGLTNGNTYYFKVFGYNGSTGAELYCTLTSTNTGNGQPTSTATWDGSSSTDWATGSNWDINTVPASNYSVIIPTGISNMPTISASAGSITNLTVQSGATLTIANGGSLTVSGNASFLSPSGSGASGALVIPGTGTFTVSGTTSIERYDPDNNWRLYSVPVSSSSISPFTGYFVNSYNETSASWTHLTSSSSVSVMQGLSVMYSTSTNPSRTITFTGTLNNGNQSASVTNTSSTGDGWNLIGNPYPSPIDWAGGNVSFSDGAQTTAYLYNGSSYGYVNSAGTTSGGATRYIPAMQGFFLHATAGGTVSLTNATRVSSSQSFYKKGESAYPLLRIATKNDFYSSDAVVVFYDDAHSDFDSKYDAYFKFGSNDSVPEIYTINTDGISYAINGLNTDIIQSMTEPFVVDLGIRTNIEKPVTFSISEKSNLPDIDYIYLYDNLFETYYDIVNDEKTLFINQETNDRFKLILSKNALSNNDQIAKYKIEIFTNKKEIFIKSDYFEQNKATIQVFDMMGRLIISKPTDRAETQKVLLNKMGSFIIKVTGNQLSANQIVIVN